MILNQTAELGAVVIGRNEGERLKRCLASLASLYPVVYVDSGSTDDSVQWAKNNGAAVVELDSDTPFTAARARNAGFRQIQQIAPQGEYIQFLDGDCEMKDSWPQTACSFLRSHPDVAAVCGGLRERNPDKTIYNWLCAVEWNQPVGEVRAFGGNVAIRVSALKNVDGYRDEVIAAEEDELCVRLRAVGWRIWRLTQEMALHDADMTSFAQWWRRSKRCGYAYAVGSYLHGASAERHFVWESRRALIWGIWLPLACLSATIIAWPLGMLTWVVYPLQGMRQIVRTHGSLHRRATIAFYQGLARFPEALGQLAFARDRLYGRTRLHTSRHGEG